MFNYIFNGPPSGPAPGSPALAADVVNGSLYVSSANGSWKPAGSGLVGAVNSTTLVAPVAATTIYTVTPSTTGMYSIDFYAKLITVGTSPVLGPLTVTYFDTDGVAQSVVVAAQTQAGTNATSLTATTTAQNIGGSAIINAGAGAIQIAFAQTGTIGAGVYELKIRAEYLG